MPLWCCLVKPDHSQTKNIPLQFGVRVNRREECLGMTDWSAKPFIYEINTSVWLTTLSQRFQHSITLDNVPDRVLDELARMNVDVIWLMGVWQRSVAGRESALNYTHEYRQVLPDLDEEDVIGSAYAIASYEVDQCFGGEEALQRLRSRLQERGLKLILDYVPNHVATDHYWVTQRPECLVSGNEEALRANSDLFFAVGNGSGENLVIAHGRDPHFPGWIDTAQVNAFSSEFRREAVRILLDIAARCDGVRCDMAMLMINGVFAKTWGDYVTETVPQTEFWEYVIPAVKEQYPSFKFIAEVYWGMEYTLLKQGFDMTYDKRLYDQIQDESVAEIHQHLQAKLSFQARQVRFIENHDESRAAVSLGIEKSRAAATLICTLPGAVLLHDGQLAGRRVKLPVQINRQPDEAHNRALANFYHRLLSETHTSIYRNGRWRLLEVKKAYSGNTTHDNLLAYGWSHEGKYRIVIVNLTSSWSQGVIKLTAWGKVRQQYWRLYDVLAGVYTYRDGDRIIDEGLYVELEAFQSQILRFEPVTGARDGYHPPMLGEK